MNLVDKINEFYWYHCIRLGEIYTDGDYDLEPLVPQYCIPENLTGKKVLDVGRASGFFSFLMEERGADVTATDLPSFFSWDFVGGEQTLNERKDTIASEADFTKREILGAFDFARSYRNSKVKSTLINVYDLSPETMGEQYDLVFCGSLLSHLRDPLLALERIYSVTKDQLILSCPVLDEQINLPVMAFGGAFDPDKRTWWLPNIICVIELLKSVNFQRVELISTFNLVNRRVDLSVSHAVFHGFRSA